MKPVVLLVDDNEEILDFISGDLADKYTVLKAFDGSEALGIISEEVVQIIVCDVMMPVMDGFELCKRVKSDLDYSHIPFILLTAKNTLQSKIEGLELGADAYIEKPFSPEYLQAQIASLLANRAKIKDYFASSPKANIKTIAYSRSDELFLESLTVAIHKNLEDPELDIDKLARELLISKPTLYRKIKNISDLTPNELVNLTRLKKAAELLESHDYKMYEIAAMVGYSSQNNFGRNFLKQFGMPPSDYQQLKQGGKGK